MYDYLFHILLLLLQPDKGVEQRHFTGTIQAFDDRMAAMKAWQAIDAECHRLEQETGAKIATAEFRVERADQDVT